MTTLVHELFFYCFQGEKASAAAAAAVFFPSSHKLQSGYICPFTVVTDKTEA